MKQTLIDNSPAWMLMSPSELEDHEADERRTDRNRMIVLAVLILPLIAAVMLG